MDTVEPTSAMPAILAQLAQLDLPDGVCDDEGRIQVVTIHALKHNAERRLEKLKADAAKHNREFLSVEEHDHAVREIAVIKYVVLPFVCNEMGVSYKYSEE